jgi:hypothetical protein
MAFASGPGKVLSVNEEVTFGTLVAAGGVSLDRTSSTVDLTKDKYTSAAIRSDYQIAVSRHGMQKAGGDISGELNPGLYTRLIQAHVRRDFVAGATTGAVATISTTNTTFHRSAGSFFTNGFKVGSVVAATGFTTGGSAVNSKRVILTGVTASDLTCLNMDGTATTFGTIAAGDTVTISEIGNVTYMPASSHTDKSFSIEHWYSDITQSEPFVGCKINTMDVTVPTTGLIGVKFGVLGQKLTSRPTTQQLTSPSTPTVGRGLVSASGLILVQGAAVGYLNSINFQTSNQQSVDGVVGSNYTPFVWQGTFIGSGSLTAFFQDATFRDYFVDETEISIIVLLTDRSGTSAEFLCASMPRVKINGATKDDKQSGGLKLTGNFEFLRNTSGGSGTNSEDTTIRWQSSL